jgi:hypothetical protein
MSHHASYHYDPQWRFAEANTPSTASKMVHAVCALANSSTAFHGHACSARVPSAQCSKPQPDYTLSANVLRDPCRQKPQGTQHSQACNKLAENNIGSADKVPMHGTMRCCGQCRGSVCEW